MGADAICRRLRVVSGFCTLAGRLILPLLVVVPLAACDRLTSPSPGPEPTVPSNPPGTPEEEVVFNGDISVDDDPTCEPYLSGGLRVCDTYTFTAGASGTALLTGEWSPAEPGARNYLLPSFNGTAYGSGNETPVERAGFGILTFPVVGGQTNRVLVYVVPAGQGRSAYTLRVKYPK